MQTELITLELPDGSTNKITLLGNDFSTVQPLVVLFPAMGVKASYYQPFAEALAKKGNLVVTADLRGLGHSSVRPSRKTDFGYIEMLDLDYQTILYYLKGRFPDHPKFMMGHSLGGQLAALNLSRNPRGVKGLILIASCSVYYKGWKGMQGFKTLMGTQSMKVISSILGYLPGKKIGFGGTEAKSVIKDWSHQSKTGKYLPNHKDFDFEKGLSELKTPTLSISLEGDWMAPKQACENLYNKFHQEAPVKHVSYFKIRYLTRRIESF